MATELGFQGGEGGEMASSRMCVRKADRRPPGPGLGGREGPLGSTAVPSSPGGGRCWSHGCERPATQTPLHTLKCPQLTLCRPHLNRGSVKNTFVQSFSA